MKILSWGCRITSPDDEWMTEGTRQYRMPVRRRNGALDIAQTISRYRRGAAPARRNAGSEEVLYVYAGAGQCRIDDHLYEIRSGHAIYIPPGALFQIVNRQDEPLEIVGACCPEETSVEIFPGPIMNPASPGQTPDEKRRLVIHESEREAIPTGDRTFRLLVHQDLGCQRVTQFLGFIPPSRAPHHYHTYEEVIFILQGRGIIHADEAACEFAAGTSIYLAPGQRHCLENPGPEDVRLLGVFYPSGSPGVNYKD
jgi:mannose-6-phosphate isomerase-like protein (cupin superfamily)